MSRTIHYGDYVSITLPGDTTGRSVALLPDGSVSLESSNQAGEKKWALTNKKDPDSTIPVEYGDTFYLKSAGDGGYVIMTGDVLSMTTTLAGNEAEGTWQILRPNGNATLGAVKSGDTVSIGSWIGGSITRDSENWVLTFGYPMLGSFLRYGNEVFICANTSGNSVVADTTTQVPGTDMYGITSDTGNKSKRQDWIVSNFDDRNSLGQMNFGDRLLFTLDTPTPGPRYLSCRQDTDAGLGDKGVTASSIAGDWEAWTVLDPSNTSSKRQIKVGDTLTLQNMNPGYYLSSRQDSPQNPAITAGASAGDTEKWVFSPLIAAGKPASATVQELPTPSDNSAATLNFGADVGTTIALGIVQGASSLLPEEGQSIAQSVMGGLINYLYPQTGPDVWALIKAQVEALVKQEIQDDKIQSFNDTLDGIKATLQEYVALTDPVRKGTDLQDILNAFTSLKAQEKEIVAPQRALPYLVMLGTLHISALQEMYLHGAQYFSTGADSSLDHKNLKDDINYYSGRLTTLKAGAMDWRRSLFSKGMGQADGLPYFIDNYRTNGVGSLLYGRADQFDTYQQKMVDIFSEQLDAFMIPSFLWRYMDPDCQDVPMRRSAFMATGPFGAGLNGDVFFYDPQYGPIIEISVSTGDFVCGITTVYASGMFQKHGASGTDHALAVPSNMKIVKANGFEGDQLNDLWLGSDDGQTWVGGGPHTGNTWNAEPPSGADAFLVGFSGNASKTVATENGPVEGRVGSLYLHWKYNRWE